jgi:hypothetical protein
MSIERNRIESLINTSRLETRLEIPLLSDSPISAGYSRCASYSRCYTLDESKPAAPSSDPTADRALLEALRSRLMRKNAFAATHL